MQAQQAAMFLGHVPNPQTGQPEVNLEFARPSHVFTGIRTRIPQTVQQKLRLIRTQAVAAVCDRRWVRIPGLIETLLQWKTVL